MPNRDVKGLCRTWIDHSCEVESSAADLYALLKDVDAWSAWTPGLLAIKRRTQGEYVPGTRFTMVLSAPVIGKVALPCEMFVNEPSLLEWGGGALGAKIRHRFELHALSPERTRLRHLEYATGFLSVVAMPFEKSIHHHDKRWSDAIRERYAARP